MEVKQEAAAYIDDSIDNKHCATLDVMDDNDDEEEDEQDEPRKIKVENCDDVEMVVQEEAEELIEIDNEERVESDGPSLGDLLSLVDEFQPAIPDRVAQYYLERAGFDAYDPRVVRLLSLATQKFISDVAADALQLSKLRGADLSFSSSTGGSGGANATASGGTTSSSKRPAGGVNSRAGGVEKKLTLTMEELTPALAEYGVNVKKPPYHC